MKAGGKGLWGWMFFDWANQPFHTVIVLFVFGPYFASQVAEDVVSGQAIWGYAIATGSVLMALSAPVLGAVADAQGPRKPWILAFSLVYVIGAAGLWYAEPGMADPLPILVLLAVALIGAEITLVFVNSLLPEVGPREELGRISGSGWAFGYWGGLVALGHRARPDDAGAGLRQNHTRHGAGLRPGPGPGRRRACERAVLGALVRRLHGGPSSSGRRMRAGARAEPPARSPRGCAA